MQVKKLSAFALVLLFSAFLAGCEPPEPPYPRINVFGSGSGGGFDELGATVGLEWLFGAVDPEDIIDVATVSVDLRQSNIDITSTSGFLLLKLSNNGHIVAGQTFNWIMQMDQVVLANPTAVNGFVLNHAGSFNKFDLEFQVTANPVVGVNSIVAEFKQGQDLLAGVAVSEYLQECDLGHENNFECEQTLGF